MRTLQYGGVLHPGDLIAVSNGNHISFGWYAGDGKGTLQYYYMSGPGELYDNYLQWKNNPLDIKNWRSRQFEKHGFSIKLCYKSYINSVHATRVMKVTNPEEIFTDKKNREQYEKSKEALITLNFIQK